MAVWTFWIGLISSILFFAYFEFQHYQANAAQSNMSNIERQLNSNKLPMVEDSTADNNCCSDNKTCQ